MLVVEGGGVQMRLLGNLLVLSLGACCLKPASETVVEETPDSGVIHPMPIPDTDAGPPDAGIPDSGPPVHCSWDSDCAAGSYCRVDTSSVCPGQWPGIDPPATAEQAECVACDPGQPCPPEVECVRQPDCPADCPAYLGCGPCICRLCPPPPDAGGMIVAVDGGPPAIEVTTVGGNLEQQAGLRDGAAHEALFVNPAAVVVTADGNVLIADEGNNRIRLLDVISYTVTTFAGDSWGYQDGPRLSALFQAPIDLAVDGSGRIVTLDGPGRVRRIDELGNVTTLDDLSRSLPCQPETKFAVDPIGNVFMAENCINQIEKIDTNGVYTVVAGAGSSSPGFMNGTGGPNGTAAFWWPSGIAINSVGDLLVADWGNSCIRKIDTQGNVTTFSGSPKYGGDCLGMTDGPADLSEFCKPTGLALDGAGNLIVADTGNAAIRRVDATGAVTTLAGGFGVVGNVDGSGGSMGTAALTWPTGVAVAPNGDIFFTDFQTIRRIRFH